MFNAVVTGCALFCFAVVVGIGVMMVSDPTEATILNWLARTAENSKREAIMMSPEVQELEIENDRLHQQIRAMFHSCPPHPPSLGERLSGFLPWGGGDGD